jgi:protein SCO1
MRKTTINWAMLVLMLLLSACSRQEQSSIPYFSDSDLSPTWKQHSDVQPSTVRSVGAFSFVDQENEIVSNESLRGKPYVASFFFVDCTNVCPTLKTRLTVVQQQFSADQLSIVSHSVAPETDTVQRLSNYSKVNEINPEKWHLVTGNKDQIIQLATERYGAELTNQSGQGNLESDYLHTEILYLVDREGYLRGMYNGTLQLEVERLIEDATVLVGE